MDQASERLTARQLAKRYGVTPDTVRAWARKGIIPRIWVSRKVIRFDPVAVEATLTTRSQHEEGAR